MQNIHVLSTDKSSRLHKIGNEWGLTHNANSNPFAKQQNIYIISDEKIEEGGWFYDLDSKYIKIKQSWENSHLDFNGKKIILTTDQDLIKDGVQAIDDEFLEWFVKNPSCDEVEVLRCPIEGLYTIISKEEPKQETIEEAAETTYSDKLYPMYGGLRRDAFINGAKWQQERMYSEEEVLNLLQDFANEDFSSVINIKEWFEQFKKK